MVHIKGGPRTIVHHLSQRLLYRWVPKWYEAFCDPQSGLFYERVGHAFKPVETGRRRLLTQCRQLSVYAHAKSCGTFSPDLSAHFDRLIADYYVPGTGGWIFALDDAGARADTHYDLYAHAFAIFALCHYDRAQPDARARELADKIAAFISNHFRVSGGAGFHEKLDETLTPVPERRRHESHMHLLEACLFAAHHWHDETFIALSDELIDLFFSSFYEAEKNRLSEYFTDDLTPLEDKGVIIVEPGHYGEWIWLLKKYAALKGNPDQYDDICLRMLSFANKFGWDDIYGGIYDELADDGSVIEETKRIWPFTELLKANALMLDRAKAQRQEIKAFIAKMTALFNDKYMAERGFWTEWLTRDLEPAAGYMPGTTPYHVYFGIMETREALTKRGKKRLKSLRAGPRAFIYRLRRRVSDIVKALRYKVKSL